MKSLFEAIAIAALITVPLAAFAQSTNQQPLTRAQVRADLVRVEQAGFDPTDRVHYPQNIQAAEARIAAENATHDSGVGASTNGSSQSGQ